MTFTLGAPVIVKSVQGGTVSIAGNAGTTGTATISAVGSLAETRLLGTHCDNTTGDFRCLGRISRSDATTITLTRTINPTVATYAQFEVTDHA